MEFRDLPVYRNKGEILAALRDNQAIVIESPTGSGKTTQLPLILLEAGYANEGMIGITQPRRIAALTVTDFIKRQLELEEGNNFCSCKMRFYDTTDANTRIKIMTDGILLEELKHDRTLSKYSVIMVDEAHERSLNIDFILGLLKNLIKERPELKLIISSATINTQTFSRFLGGAKIISIKAEGYPVQVAYMPPRPSWMGTPEDEGAGFATDGFASGGSPGALSSRKGGRAGRKEPPRRTSPAHGRDGVDMDDVIDSIVRIVNSKVRDFSRNGCQGSEDTLVFLPGEFDIKTCVRALAFRCDYKKLQIYPLYGRLNKEEQEQVFTPTPEGKIKVVVATNIAETSITIDGITNVIDSGLAKINFYNQKNFSSALITEKISRSSCEQRKGRAGRVAPGRCYRLYSEDDLQERKDYALEEILRTDLSEVVLRMSDLGIYDYENFPFITKPSRSAIRSAEETLRFLGAIDKERHLTKIGSLMVAFPLVPRHSRVIVEAMMNYPDVMEEILVAVSFISTRTPFVLPPGREDEARAAHRRYGSQEGGDFVGFLELFNDFSSIDSTKARTAFCDKSFLDLQTMVEILHVQEQLGEIVSHLGFVLSKGGSREDYLCCLSAGLIQNVCVKAGSREYRSVTVDRIYIHPGSAYFNSLPRFILAGEIVNTSRMFARTVSPLSKEVVQRVSPALYDDLVRRTGRAEGPQEQDAKARRQEKAKEAREPKEARTVQIYGKALKASKQDGQLTVIVPIEDLPTLSKAQAKAKRHPKNFKAVLMVGDKAVQRGDNLFNIIDLGSVLPENRIPVDLRKEEGFSVSDPAQAAAKLPLIGRFAVLPKDRGSLGFVELQATGKDECRLDVNKDLFECLTNSSYALGVLKESAKGCKALNTAYNKVMAKLNKF